ncbi:MAG TPA: hypothetical protein VEU97_09775 [Ktedonobacteraceae bacterium]|nr:hypothetical protein [Ktedonobacteraceae bacterium]
MNFLIIGGLLAIGIVAILGAILLSRGEPRTDARRGKPISQTTLMEGSGPDLSNNALPPREKSLVSAEDLRPILNGQFHELAGEVHTLHHQAWQLEQRLSALVDMVDQVERAQNSQINDEEETQQMPSDNIPR